jgi:intergrase/recombinase
MVLTDFEKFPSDNIDLKVETFIVGWNYIPGTSLKNYLEVLSSTAQSDFDFATNDRIFSGLRLSKVEEIMSDLGKSDFQYCHFYIVPNKNWVATQSDGHPERSRRAFAL